MYEDFFSLNGHPFPALPSACRYSATGPSTRCLEILSRVARRGEGPALLIGTAGVGKSAVLHALRRSLENEFQVVLLSHNRVASPRDFLQQLSFELNLPHAEGDEGQLRFALRRFLASKENCPRGLVLLVDDADGLHEQVCEELLMLSDMARGGDSVAHIVLAGGVQLEETLALPRLASLQQRIAARCYLEPLNRNETADYVSHRFAEAGGDPQVFSSESLRAIHEVTGGVPRLINQLANLALVLAARHGQARLGVDAVVEAWADLQQLPTARPEKTTSQPPSATIEFGELDDDGDQADKAGISGTHLLRAEPAVDFQDALDSLPSNPESALEAAERRIAQAQAAELDVDEPTELEPSELFDAPADTQLVSQAFHQNAQVVSAVVEDPFGRFESEEIIIDRYSSLDVGESIVGGYVTTTDRHPARSSYNSAFQWRAVPPDEQTSKTEPLPFLARDRVVANENCRPIWPPQDEADAWLGSEVDEDGHEASEIRQQWPPSTLDAARGADLFDELDSRATDTWVQPNSIAPGDRAADPSEQDNPSDQRAEFFDAARDDSDIIIVEDDPKSDEKLAVERYRALLDKMRRT